jgi:CelD/BcsL family acetyltransferase involved in cellulose biosynthesis
MSPGAPPSILPFRYDSGKAVIVVETFAAADWTKVAHLWADLAANSPYTTFFISPQWVEAWLEVFGASLPVEILIFRDAGLPVGACLLVRRTLRRGPFRVRCVFLNTAGENPGEGPCIEFNELLCLAASESAVAEALVSHLNAQPWDEFRLDGFCQGPPLDALSRALLGTPQERVVHANFYVDLKHLRETNASYESVLGSRDRARLRQNFRFYGETEVIVPDNFSNAMAALDALAALHTRSWQDRNETGAFASPVFRAFHQALIRRCIDSGFIQLARVQSSSAPVGILYNMIYRGKVYYYQSGLVYSTNKRVRPGFVTLARVIQHCLTNSELDEFHFMPGSDHYKEPMSTNRQELEWVVFQRRNLKNAAMRGLRAIKRRLFAPLRPETTGGQTESQAESQAEG